MAAYYFPAPNRLETVGKGCGFESHARRDVFVLWRGSFGRVLRFEECKDGDGEY